MSIAVWRRRLVEFGILGPPLAVVMLLGGVWASQLDMNTNFPAALEWWWAVLNRRSSEHVLWAKVDTASPVTRTVADAVKLVEPARGNQPAALAHFARDLIEYDSDMDVWGKIDYVGSVTEMDSMRAQRGWSRMRGDWDDIAVWYASIARYLGIPYQFKNTTDHIWVELWSEGQWLSIEANGSDNAAPEIGRWKPSDGPGGLERRRHEKAVDDAYKYLTSRPERTLHLFREWDVRQRMHAAFVGAVVSGFLFVLPLMRVSSRLIRGSRLRRFVDLPAQA